MQTTKPTSEQLEITYSVTPGGQFCQMLKKGSCQVFKITPSLTRFVSWMTETDEILEKTRSIQKKWWTNFNEELYNKVLIAKGLK